MDTETGEARQISQMALIPELPEFTTDTPPASIPYGCPIWSPDGQNVAAVVETDHVIHLVVMPVNVPHQNQDAPLQPGVHYWKTGSPLSFVPLQGPVWSPDGRSLYLWCGERRAKSRAWCGSACRRIRIPRCTTSRCLPARIGLQWPGYRSNPTGGQQWSCASRANPEQIQNLSSPRSRAVLPKPS